MTESIIVAVLALIGTLIGSFLSNSKGAAVMEEQIKDVKADIQNLAADVKKHNQFDARIKVIENDIVHICEQINKLGG